MVAKAHAHIAIGQSFATLAEVVQRRAVVNGEQIDYTFLDDGTADMRSLTWAALEQKARSIADTLLTHNATGERVLLSLNSGLTFIESLFACWYAGAIAVPVSLPRHHRVKHR